jgi:hypothetical protein
VKAKRLACANAFACCAEALPRDAAWQFGGHRRTDIGETFGNFMKTKVAILAFVLLLVAIISLTIHFSADRGHDPRDISYWSQVGATQDWSAKAAQGDPQAQCFHGLALIRTNLQTRIERVPRLSCIPIFSRLFFGRISYGLDSGLSRERLAEAHGWIKRSADQDFAPAKEAEKLFIGRIGLPNRGGPANGGQSAAAETIRTSEPAGPGR